VKKIAIYLLVISLFIISVQSSVLSQEKLKIAVIPKSNTAMFWKSVHTGARLGAIAMGGVDVQWRAPALENDIAQQITIVEGCISERVSGIVIAPLDNEALVAPILKAAKNKIPVLIFDSALKGKAGKDFISFVGIDNKKAGELAGEELANMMKRRGKVVMLRYAVSKSNLSNREDGFLEAISKYEGISIIEKKRFVSGTIDEAMNECLKMEEKLREADGIFCSYEQSTMGMLQALRKLNLAGKVKFMGFDTPAPAVEALKKGEISGLVAQDPPQIGFHSVKAMVDYLRGKKISTTIDVPVQIITRDNINKPETQKLLALPSQSD
jgi:ribose transport system substrate-binding protein